MIRRLKRAAKRNVVRAYRWRWTGVPNPTFGDILRATYTKSMHFYRLPIDTPLKADLARPRVLTFGTWQAR